MNGSRQVLAMAADTTKRETTRHVHLLMNGHSALGGSRAKNK